MKRNKHMKKKTKIFETYSVLILLATLFMSVAFAQISDIKLEITGTLTAPVQEGIFISNISSKATSGLISEEVKYYRGTALSTTVELSTTSSSYITYEISLYNNSSEEYYFTGVTYDSNAYDNTNITYTLDGIEEYITTIGARKEIKFNITFKYKDGITISKNQILNSILNFEFKNEFIEFSIEEETYSAPKGATWKQFINSEYNTYGFYITDNKVFTSNNKQLLYTDETNNIIGQEVKNTDKILENIKYIEMPTITLDKETITLEIQEAGTATETLTATVDNEELELTWEVEPENSGITISGEGNTRTITATKAVENATITVSYGVASITCIVNVEETKVLKVGDYIQYNIEYTDTYTSYNFSKDNGWRYLGKDTEGNYLIISTGIPVKLNFTAQSSQPWWDSTQTGAGMQAASGLSNITKFESIVFEDGIITGASFRDISLGDKVIGVRTLTLEELNTARGEEITSITKTSEKDAAAGLFYLRNLQNYGYSESMSELEFYWLAYSNPGLSTRLMRVGFSGSIISEETVTNGIRPVVVLSSDVNLVYNDGIWQMKEEPAVWVDNGDGTFTKRGITVTIGDYVNYIEGTYTHTPDVSKGAGTSSTGGSETEGWILATSEVTTEDLTWRVLGVNEEGQLELISANTTATGLYLANEEGYIYAEENLNNFCNDLYGKGTNSKGNKVTSGGRSLKSEDIDKIARYDPTKNSDYGVEWIYRYPTQEEMDEYTGTENSTRYMQYSTDDGKTWTDITGESYQTLRLLGETTVINSENPGTVKLKRTDYNYNIADKITTIDGYTSELVTEILTMIGKDGTREFWLSTSDVECSVYGARYRVKAYSLLR